MTFLRGVLYSLKDLFTLFWQKKQWWLIPLIVLLLLCSLLIVLGNASGAGPLIYTLF